MKTTMEKQSASPAEAIMPFLVGTIGALAVSLLLLCIFSAVMSLRDIPSVVIRALAYVSLAVGAFIGGVVSARLIRSRGLLVGAATGLVFLIVLFLAGLIARQTQFGVDMAFKVAVVVLAGGAGGVSGVNARRRKPR